MRCDLTPLTTGFTRCAVAVALTVTAESRPVPAASIACYTVQPGDTAAHIALRLTGDAEQRHEPWFQIVDPARSRFIPKAEYGRILPGWHACITEGWVSTESSQVIDRPARLARRARPRPAGIVRNLAAIDFTVVWWLVPVLLATLLASRVAERYWNDRQAVVNIMKRFGDRFIREFERPLIQPGAAGRALKTRLHCMPHQGRLKILLAPNDGKSYPNLSDHRKNVEYDVGRVLQLLRDEPFAGGQLYEQGRWVVVPCRFTVRLEQEGGH